MKTCEIILKPSSPFATPLKGDTIFGHFCWQLANDNGLARRGLEELLAVYASSPFAVFSSAYPKFCLGEAKTYALKRPDVPLSFLFDESSHSRLEILRGRKELKARRWMLVEKGRRHASLKQFEYVNDTKLASRARPSLTEDGQERMRFRDEAGFVIPDEQAHNTISRHTGATGEAPFAPFSVSHEVFYPQAKLAVFVAFDESEITLENLIAGLERIGEWGFGKDASTGLGRFSVGGSAEITLAEFGCDFPNACMTLGPCVPEKDTYTNMFFTPFTRFGKHGDVLAKSKNPFKNPVIMADEGAVLIPKDKSAFSRPYLGTAVSEVSKEQLNAVTQGYSLYIPVTLAEA